MQFIPQTWQLMGVDGDGDGVKNPQDIDDAAMSTAVYLCSGAGNLSKASDLNTAVLRYNHSQQYVDLVISIAKAYAGGSWIAVGNGTESDGQGVDRAGRPGRRPGDRRSGGRQPAAGRRPARRTREPEADVQPTMVQEGDGKPTTPPTKRPPTTKPDASRGRRQTADEQAQHPADQQAPDVPAAGATGAGEAADVGRPDRRHGRQHGDRTEQGDHLLPGRDGEGDDHPPNPGSAAEMRDRVPDRRHRRPSIR